MKFSSSIGTLTAALSILSSADCNPLGQQVVKEDAVMRRIEVEPGQVLSLTETEILDLKRNGINFFDVTDHEESSYVASSAPSPVSYPTKAYYVKEVKEIANGLSESAMREDLTHYTSYHTRYFKSDTGLEASLWLFDQVLEIANSSDFAHAEVFNHPNFPQKSIIATIRGKTDDIVVVGAHLDSINLIFPSFFAAPGADDDGSGTVTILDVFRTLIASGIEPHNTLQFHWYAAEEGGLLGSQDIFEEYAKRGKIVKAMLQQDMTGFIQKTLDAGLPESVGIITDYVDEGLTKFLKLMVDTYCDIPYVETSCGYACSDHASASKYGYPSAFVIESLFDKSDNYIHSTADTMDKLSFSHMQQHAKMTLGYAYELSFYKFA